MKEIEDDIHYCPLRDKKIEDRECFETVMAISGLHSKIYAEEVKEKYRNCKNVCNICKHNKENGSEKNECSRNNVF